MKTETAEPDLDALLADLPGAGMVRQGLQELESGDPGECGLLVLTATIRFNALGIYVPMSSQVTWPATHDLYTRLEQMYPGDAYARFNSMMRLLASFIHALEHRVNRTKERVQL